MRFDRRYAALTCALLLSEILIALFVRDAIVRPYVGDALAVVLVYAGLRTITRLGVMPATLLALLTAVAIEFGQYFRLLDHIGLAGNRWARIILGSGFDRQGLRGLCRRCARRPARRTLPPRIPRRRRHPHRQAVQRFVQHDLTRQPAGRDGTLRKVQHILLLFARGSHACEVRGIDDDMAGRTGHLPAARPLQRQVIRLRQIEQPVTRRPPRFLHLSIGAHEANDHRCPRAAWSIACNACTSSSSPV